MITIVTTATTVFMFSLEALIHYNIGRTGRIGLSTLPKGKELFRTITIVVIFALLAQATSLFFQLLFFSSDEEALLARLDDDDAEKICDACVRKRMRLSKVT